MRRSVRAAEGAGLENQWAEMSRGFESHGLRHLVAVSNFVENYHSRRYLPRIVGAVGASSCLTVQRTEIGT